jgi:hypothetical protein
MTVCESCHQLCNGLGPYCMDCERDFEEYENDECKRCGGSGEIEWDDGVCSIEQMIECYVCKGTGALK